MHNLKYMLILSVYYMRPIPTYLLAKKIEYNSLASEMLQIEIDISYTTFPNDFVMAKSCTCACFSVTTVPKIAKTAVWANSIVALRVHVAGGRRGGALINICGKHEKCFNKNKDEEIERLRDIMMSLRQVRRKFWHQKWLTERWRERLRKKLVFSKCTALNIR